MADTAPLQQLKELGLSIPKRYRILTIATAAAIGAAVLAFSYMHRGGDYRPVYKSLSPEDAGTIVQKLKEKGVSYRLSEDGSSVLVPSGKVADVRLEMAAAGLPKSGRIGFELFDQTKFGATDFMEHVNYRRALEGELERSMTALSEVEQARVHLTFAKDSVFSENRLPAKGSVMLKLRAPLSEQNVAAVRYLVASAVEGLTPESVSVVDMKGNLLGKPKGKSAFDGGESSEAVIEYRRTIERDLLAKVNSTLEPLLGPDHFRASVVAECDFTASEQSEEILDPERSVKTREQHSLETNATANASGVPGTTSNLPRATPRPGANAQVTRETSDVSYQTARTVRHTRSPQGSIKRLSVSVLVDHVARWDGKGSDLRRVSHAPSQETLGRITDIVSAAAGIVPERGDRLVVQSLPFETNQEMPTTSEPSPTGNDWMNKILTPQALMLVVIIAAVFFVMRNHQKRQKEILAARQVQQVIPPAASAPSAQIQPVPETALERLASQLEEQRVRIPDLRQQELEAAGSEMQRLITEAIQMAQNDSELCVGVLRTWITEKERDAKA